MNNKKRQKIKIAQEYLSQASNIISDVLDEEQDCLDNMPENLQSSDRCECMEIAVSKLEEAIESIEQAEESLTEAIG